MSDVSGVLTPVMLGATINTISSFNKGAGKIAPVVLGNVGLYVALNVVGEAIDWGIASALAWVYVLASFLLRGGPVIDWFSKLTTGN